MRICRRTHQGKRLSTGFLIHHICKQRSTFKFYVAGALKFESIRIYLDKIENILHKNGFTTWSPYKDAGILSNEDLKNATKVKETLEKDIVAFHECDGAIFLLDGYHTGTIFELGYAYYLARNIKKNFILIGIYTTITGKEALDSMVKFCLENKGMIITSLSGLERIITEIRNSSFRLKR